MAEPARRRIPLLVLLPILLFTSFVGAALFGMKHKSDELPSTRIGQPAPPIAAVTLPGHNAVARTHVASGRVTLVNFWASWCPPCRAEHRTLLDLQAEGFPVIGINFKDNAKDAVDYLAESKSPFVAVAYDPAGRTAIDWGVTAPPETFILDGEGRVVFRFIGPLVGSDYRDRFVPELERALDQG